MSFRTRIGFCWEKSRTVCRWEIPDRFIQDRCILRESSVVAFWGWSTYNHKFENWTESIYIRLFSDNPPLQNILDLLRINIYFQSRVIVISLWIEEAGESNWQINSMWFQESTRVMIGFLPCTTAVCNKFLGSSRSTDWRCFGVWFEDDTGYASCNL